MNTQRLTERDRATLDRIVRPAEVVQAALNEFIDSPQFRTLIREMVRQEIQGARQCH